MSVKILPMFCISGNAGSISEILVRISIGAFSIRRIGAGSFTGTSPCIAGLNRFMTDPFVPHGTVLSA